MSLEESKGSLQMKSRQTLESNPAATGLNHFLSSRSNAYLERFPGFAGVNYDFPNHRVEIIQFQKPEVNGPIYSIPQNTTCIDPEKRSLASDPASGYEDIPLEPSAVSHNVGDCDGGCDGVAQQSSFWLCLAEAGQRLSRVLPKRAQSHPFAKGFEPPQWRSIFIHIIMCLVSYPVLVAFAAVARGRTLFWTRLVVALECGIVSFFLGLSLLNLGRAFFEAASESSL